MMQGKERLHLVRAVFTAILGFLAAAAPSHAATHKVLHTFTGGKDGSSPYDSLILDAAGNLYGTTSAGANTECGAVFELLPGANGKWKEKTLFDFYPSGCEPIGGLVMDKAGNLYGTTTSGGSTDDTSTVFELSPGSDGSWTENVIYNFDGPFAISKPQSSLIFDVAGNLYGTTADGGANGDGTVFELTPGANGVWAETTIWTFDYFGTGGYSPYAGVVFDSAGNLYGTTVFGGSGAGCTAANGCGTVFKLTPEANGTWNETVLYSFNDNGADGYNPYGGVVFDSAGNLYGTTYYGGKNTADGGYSGTVFKLSPHANGTWSEKLLHSFGGDSNVGDGYQPYAGLTFENGDLYGTTVLGGKYNGGTVFELVPGSNGKWTEKIVYSFDNSSNSCSNGCEPYSAVIFDAAGNLYGTTTEGGSGVGHGTAYEITP
jgi:uncharacterized repeat protein (TIGR03803 family)